MAFVYVVRCNFNEPAKEQPERVVQRPEDRADAGEAAFLSCQRFKRMSGNGRLSRALDAAIAGRVQDRAIHLRLGLLRMGAAHHRLEPRPVRRRQRPGASLRRVRARWPAHRLVRRREPR